MRELQHALRRLGGSPMFTVAATLTMAIAIGATASVFSLLDGVLLKAFPFREPDRAVLILESNPTLHLSPYPVSAANYMDWRTQNTAFTTLAAIAGRQYTETGGRVPERVIGAAVTPNYFAALGAEPALGRALARDSGGPAEVVISDAYWQRRFGGAPSAIGQTVRLDDQPYTVVGVMPPGFPGLNDVWTRLSFSAADEIDRQFRNYYVYGRLKPGVTATTAQSQMATIAARLARAFPQTNKGWSVTVTPLLQFVVGNVKPALIALFCAAGCVLLIGTANLANLFLVRCLAREREMAVRAAMGAGRRRLVGELLLEASIVAFIAGALGVGVAVAGAHGLRALAPVTMPRLNEVTVDGRVVAFCALVSATTVLLFGVLPAWRTSRTNLAELLKDGGRGTDSTRRHRLQDLLVTVQIGVALVLLTGAGLLVKGIEHLWHQPLGFEPDHVLTALVNLPAKRYPTGAQQIAFFTGLIDRLATQPGIVDASASDAVPGDNFYPARFTIVGTSVDQTDVPTGYVLGVTPDFFRTMGIKLLRGRGILPTDDDQSVRVAVIDALLARQYFGQRDPIGQRLALQDTADTMEIVGIATSVKMGGLTAANRPAVYIPWAQWPDMYANVAVRTLGDPAKAIPLLKRFVAAADSTVPLSYVLPLSKRVAFSVGTTRFASFLAVLFAAIAVTLGVIGIYSVLAYIATQRRRDIAIRMALGATPSDVFREVLRHAVVLTGLGIILGAGAAWILTRVLASLFVGVSPHDPEIFIGAAVTFATVALLAASAPAFRTTRVSPVVALTAT